MSKNKNVINVSPGCIDEIKAALIRAGYDVNYFYNAQLNELDMKRVLLKGPVPTSKEESPYFVASRGA